MQKLLLKQVMCPILIIFLIHFCQVFIDGVAFSAAYICLNMPRVFWTMQRTCNILDPRFSVCFAHFVACYRERLSHPLSICGVLSGKAFAASFSTSFFKVISLHLQSSCLRLCNIIYSMYETSVVCLKRNGHSRFRVMWNVPLIKNLSNELKTSSHYTLHIQPWSNNLI